MLPLQTDPISMIIFNGGIILVKINTIMSMPYVERAGPRGNIARPKVLKIKSSLDGRSARLKIYLGLELELRLLFEIELGFRII